MRTIYQHPSTVSGVAVDRSTGQISTSCFDGKVRRFASADATLPEFTEQRAFASINPVSYAQLNCVAIRNGVIACDDGFSTLKEGVAITGIGQVIHPADFGVATRILSIDETGRYGLGVDQNIYDRATGTHWLGVPATAGFDKWPMGCKLAQDNALITVDQSAFIRVWINAVQVLAIPIAAPGIAMDVSPDGSKIVVVDENIGLAVYTRAGMLIKRTVGHDFIHCVKFVNNGMAVFGTQSGVLATWDLASDFPSATTSTPVSKPTGKHK